MEPNSTHYYHLLTRNPNEFVGILQPTDYPFVYHIERYFLVAKLISLTKSTFFLNSESERLQAGALDSVHTQDACD
ncbi:hypothetical protein L6452_27322 [Arctium lappa]|uniref:Uncharacterized protein n=1 Tax=Arctium lappa TaxID=4217 RepID=A0ACB8ZVM3_ARCLA|nr:hypothetical protein L6452_27322 [Arctium lappa]